MHLVAQGGRAPQTSIFISDVYTCLYLEPSLKGSHLQLSFCINFVLFIYIRIKLLF